MIRTEDHKYIWASDGRHELYDLRADSAEVHNLIADRPDLAADFAQRLADWQGSFEPADPTRQAPEFDEAVKDRLRALGYLE
jgi:histone deacetylase complex regulatory component SIN3